MGDLSATSYLILGMLRLGSRTGYEIKRTVDLSTRFFWAASHAQIYPELKRLVEGGYINSKPDRKSGRKRVLYSLKPAGRKALHQWLAAEGEDAVVLRDMGLLKLFFADLLDRGQALELVRKIKKRHERMRAHLEKSEPAARELARSGQNFPLATLSFGLDFHEWAAGWCEKLEREIKSA